MKRTICSGCGGTSLDVFLDLGDSPIADAYTATPNEHVGRYPLQLATCASCRLVQLLEVVDDLFGTGYSFYSSASAPLSAYHEDYAAAVLARHRGLAERLTVEVGCNDGDLLRHFPGPAVGVDPSTGPAGLARSRGLDVIGEAFGLDIAEQLRDERGPAGIVIANHVLAHVADVSDVLAGIAHLLDDDGVAMVEVQYLPDLLVNNAFDLAYHEHRNFFSLTTLAHAAARHELGVVDAELTDRQGGSLRVTLASAATVPTRRAWQILDSEEWLKRSGAYEGLQGRVERIRTRLQDLVADEKGLGHVVAGYGAPAKATTLLNYCGIELDHVTDTTPAKQGRYIPGTSARIVAPAAAPNADTHLLLAWNYMPQIVRNNPGNRWIVPIPAPVLL